MASQTVVRAADQRSSAALPSLHPGSIVDSDRIRSLLESLRDSKTRLFRGMNRRIDPEVATIDRLSESDLLLATSNFEKDDREILFLNFVFDSRPYFFETRMLEKIADTKIRIEFPQKIYKSERRARSRRQILDQAKRLSLQIPGRARQDAILVDSSPEGIAAEVDEEFARALEPGVEISLSDTRSITCSFGVLRNTRGAPDRPHRVLLGLELRPSSTGELRCETYQELGPGTLAGRAGQTARIALGGAQLAFERAIRRFTGDNNLFEPNVIEIRNQIGQPIRAILDSDGPFPDSTAVIIPPAWGRTKETLMPLSLTIVECFKRARRPVSVIRFDGINRRGESFRADGLGPEARDQKHFTFSQGATDIQTVVDHLHAHPDGPPAKTIVVSFSAASIEARRAVLNDDRIDGWVCVVGSADLQSMMRSISGGIDYARGLENGATFGLQEILGVTVDMDLAGRDALENQLVYLSDARRDMAAIRAPVTWIHGKHDAWMDKIRVQDVLSCGDTAARKFIEVPTGHMLKSSRDALGVFQLIASEVSLIVSGHRAPAAVPSLVGLERRERAERARLPKTSPEEVKAFWEDYLLGRDRTIGIELMTLTSAYRDLMFRQIDALDIRTEQRVADLGAGTGAFPLYLREHSANSMGPKVLAVDFVRGALQRARMRLGGADFVWPVDADLGVAGRRNLLPISDGSVDRVLASLFLSYVPNASKVLDEAFRILRPGGRIVISSLRRDADMSKLFMEGVAELEKRWEDELAPLAAGISLEVATRAYLNEASRLLDLEEQGEFSFWDADELQKMLRDASFQDIRSAVAFGSPPQAVIAWAVRPEE